MGLGLGVRALTNPKPNPNPTQVGPYDTDYDRKRADAIEGQDNSIHPKAFVPGGLWEKFDPSQTGIGGISPTHTLNPSP